MTFVLSIERWTRGRPPTHLYLETVEAFAALSQEEAIAHAQARQLQLGALNVAVVKLHGPFFPARPGVPS